MQKCLNDPTAKGTALQDEHRNFLKILINKLKKRKINIYLPASLFNHAVFDKLSENEQERANLAAINLLNIIRQIETLWTFERRETFQIQNLVETVWQMKSQYEQTHGNVFII